MEELERRKQRAAKFGTAPPTKEEEDAAKRLARAIKYGTLDEATKRAIRMQRFNEGKKEDAGGKSEKRGENAPPAKKVGAVVCEMFVVLRSYVCALHTCVCVYATYGWWFSPTCCLLHRCDQQHRQHDECVCCKCRKTTETRHACVFTTQSVHKDLDLLPVYRNWRCLWRKNAQNEKKPYTRNAHMGCVSENTHMLHSLSMHFLVGSCVNATPPACGIVYRATYPHMLPCVYTSMPLVWI